MEEKIINPSVEEVKEEIAEVTNQEEYNPEKTMVDIVELLKLKRVSREGLTSQEKRLLDQIEHPVRKVEPKNPEEGTAFIINLLHQYPGIMLHELINRSGFSKKKVKRLLNNKFVKEITRFGVTKYYFVEE